MRDDSYAVSVSVSPPGTPNTFNSGTTCPAVLVTDSDSSSVASTDDSDEESGVSSVVDASSLAGRGRMIEFRVIDTGKGISADDLGHLFTPFLQADSSISRVYGGVCMCACVRVRVRVCVCVCVCARVSEGECVSVYVVEVSSAQAPRHAHQHTLHTCTHARTHARTHTQTHRHRHTHTYLPSRTHARTHTHTDTQTHRHTHTFLPSPIGTGLGLSICRSLARLMGGDAWGTSEGEGKGSEFVFTANLMPCGPPDSEPGQTTDFISRDGHGLHLSSAQMPAEWRNQESPQVPILGLGGSEQALSYPPTPRSYSAPPLSSYVRSSSTDKNYNTGTAADVADIDAIAHVSVSAQGSKSAPTATTTSRGRRSIFSVSFASLGRSKTSSSAASSQVSIASKGGDSINKPHARRSKSKAKGHHHKHSGSHSTTDIEHKRGNNSSSRLSVAQPDIPEGTSIVGSRRGSLAPAPLPVPVVLVVDDNVINLAVSMVSLPLSLSLSVSQSNALQ